MPSAIAVLALGVIAVMFVRFLLIACLTSVMRVGMVFTVGASAMSKTCGVHRRRSMTPAGMLKRAAMKRWRGTMLAVTTTCHSKMRWFGVVAPFTPIVMAGAIIVTELVMMAEPMLRRTTKRAVGSGVMTREMVPIATTMPFAMVVRVAVMASIAVMVGITMTSVMLGMLPSVTAMHVIMCRTMVMARAMPGMVCSMAAMAGRVRMMAFMAAAVTVIRPPMSRGVVAAAVCAFTPALTV